MIDKGECFISEAELSSSFLKLGEYAMAYLAKEKGCPLSGMINPKLRKDYIYQREDFVDGIIIKWKKVTDE